MTQLYKETIGDFVKKHTDDKNQSVPLHKYRADYLDIEGYHLFRRLIGLVVGGYIYAEFDEDGDVVIRGDGNIYFGCYSNDFLVAAVYLDLIRKMLVVVKNCMDSIKEQYTKNKELRILRSTDTATYFCLEYFANDYGIEIKKGEDNKEAYIEIIGISPLPITSK